MVKEWECEFCQACSYMSSVECLLFDLPSVLARFFENLLSLSLYHSHFSLLRFSPSEGVTEESRISGR